MNFILQGIGFAVSVHEIHFCPLVSKFCSGVGFGLKLREPNRGKMCPVAPRHWPSQSQRFHIPAYLASYSECNSNFLDFVKLCQAEFHFHHYLNGIIAASDVVWQARKENGRKIMCTCRKKKKKRQTAVKGEENKHKRHLFALICEGDEAPSASDSWHLALILQSVIMCFISLFHVDAMKHKGRPPSRQGNRFICVNCNFLCNIVSQGDTGFIHSETKLDFYLFIYF